MKPDLQDLPPEKPLPLERVGIRGYRKRIVVKGPDGVHVYDAVMDAYVSIGPERRGIHLSRSVEAFIEAVEGVRTPVDEEPMEAYLERVALRLLEKHPYALRSQVSARITDYIELSWGDGRAAQEPFDAWVSVTAWRNGSRVWRVEVSLAGMTACPHAMETVREILGAGDSLVPTHTQRAILKLSVETESRMVRFDLLAREAIWAFSAPAVSLLKRYDEARLILRAMENPRLAEDVVRDAVERTKQLVSGPWLSICARLESLESIHPFNVYAEACIGGE